MDSLFAQPALAIALKAGKDLGLALRMLYGQLIAMFQGIEGRRIGGTRSDDKNGTRRSVTDNE